MAITNGHGPVPGMLKGAIDGGVYWWVAPSYKVILNSEIWPRLKQATRYAQAKDRGVSEQDKEIRLVNGATIAVRSADSGTSLRGPGLNGLVLDECAFLAREKWIEELRPSLADKQGWAMLLSTPNGKNWFYKSFLEAETRPGWERWQRPSSDNPLLTQAEIEDLERTLGPRAFAQEHLAAFTDIEGAIFPGDYFEDHIWAREWPHAFELSALYCDPSLGGEARAGDFSAIAFVGLSGNKLWVKMDLARRPPVQLVADFYRLSELYQPTVCGIEGNAFQAVLQPLADQWCQLNHKPPLPLQLIRHGKADPKMRIQRLDSRLANRQIIFWRSDSAEKTVEQLQMFPDKGYHDDGPDALEGAIDLMCRFTQQAQDEQDGGYTYAAV